MLKLYPLGAGKSTLLDVLSGRTEDGNLDGEIVISGRECTANQRKHIVGYVEQQDILMPSLTVMEMLLYSAKVQTKTKWGKVGSSVVC